MKKTFVFLAAMILFAACSKEFQPVLESVDGTKIMYLTASIPDMKGRTETKAAVTDESFSWNNGDVIAIPNMIGGTPGFAQFTYSSSTGKFSHSLAANETIVSGTAYYPYSSREGGDYSTSFGTPAAAAESFKMTATYKAGDASIAFAHQSALINLNFSNVPSFATSIEVAEGGSTVAIVALSSPSATLNVKVPVPPSESAATYTITLKQGSNVIKTVQEKGTKEDEVYKGITLSKGTYYTTPSIKVDVVQVGVIDYVYGWSGHNTGWKLYTDKGDVDLISLGTTRSQAVGSSYWDDAEKTFYMFYAPVATDISEFKAYWTNGTNSDWFGNNSSYSSTDLNYVFVFEYSNNKLSVYMTNV